MRAQRETWLKDLPESIAYKYFLGQPCGDDPDAIYLPMADGPIFERKFQRTWILNRKTEALVRYAFERDYDFVFKCDDDTYVHIERLLASGFEAHDYSGCTDLHHAKNVGNYHWAQGGAGYWLSRRAMAVVSQHGLHRMREEDFAVGQLLAANGIAPHHDARYVPKLTPADIKNPETVTFHKVDPALMRHIYEFQFQEAVQVPVPPIKINRRKPSWQQ
jgi:hypothetical protein